MMYTVTCMIYFSPQNKYLRSIDVQAENRSEALLNAHCKLRAELGFSAGIYADSATEKK